MTEKQKQNRSFFDFVFSKSDKKVVSETVFKSHIAQHASSRELDEDLRDSWLRQPYIYRAEGAFSSSTAYPHSGFSFVLTSRPEPRFIGMFGAMDEEKSASNASFEVHIF